jgi:3-deoxy-manno-octulosonate cytidylyltransferase (CMP-KDO synthetase)
MIKAVVIIPARWGSSRFPGKPLYQIAGKPLLRHVWENCRRARKIDDTIIATDDMRIAGAAFQWGAEIALTSPKHQSGTDRIAEVAKRSTKFSIVINVQGDEPLIDPRVIDRLVEKLQTDRKLGIVTAAHPFDNPCDAVSPHQVKVVIDRSGNALYFSRAPIPYQRDVLPRAQDRERSGKGGVLFLRHQGIYGFRRETLLQFVKWKTSPLERAESLEQLRALENGVRVHVLVTKHGSPGVDTPADAAALERNLASVAAGVSPAKQSSPATRLPPQKPGPQ